jgi:pyridoxal phosphate-dependent aminotransferase EpsN
LQALASWKSSWKPLEPTEGTSGMDSERLYLSPPHMSEDSRQLLAEAFDSNWIAPLGPHVDAFEKEFAQVVGVPHAAALSCGTAALHLSLLVLRVGTGDEVLTSSFTFAATANAITYVGARPVFIDSNRRTWNMDPDLLADEMRACARRGGLPKAVIVVDLYGQCADYEPILRTCRHYGVPVIEDAAEALGAVYRGRPAGSFGDIACFSFNGNKIITAGGGGMLASRREEWCERARFLAAQARDPAPHYQHSQIGYNYRMSNLLAAIGRGQLRVLEDRVARRRANFEFYRMNLGDLPGVEFMPEYGGGAPAFRSTRWLTCITVDPGRFGATPDEIRMALEAENIESRPLWKPMHLQPVFSDCRVRGGAVSADLFERGLCLPSGSNLSEEQLCRVVAVIRSLVASVPERGKRTSNRKRIQGGC